MGDASCPPRNVVRMLGVAGCGGEEGRGIQGGGGHPLNHRRRDVSAASRTVSLFNHSTTAAGVECCIFVRLPLDRVVCLRCVALSRAPKEGMRGGEGCMPHMLSA